MNECKNAERTDSPQLPAVLPQNSRVLGFQKNSFHSLFFSSFAILTPNAPNKYAHWGNRDCVEKGQSLLSGLFEKAILKALCGHLSSQTRSVMQRSRHSYNATEIVPALGPPTNAVRIPQRTSSAAGMCRCCNKTSCVGWLGSALCNPPPPSDKPSNPSLFKSLLSQ